jgi:hypothetical protein
MRVHGNARTTPHGRRLLVRGVAVEGWSVCEVAQAAGISERVAYPWLARVGGRVIESSQIARAGRVARRDVRLGIGWRRWSRFDDCGLPRARSAPE